MRKEFAVLMRSSAFISYSHKDKKWLEKLNEMLIPYERNGLNIWSDQKIQPGAKWAEAIRQGLADAKVAILLVSPAFLASTFIHENELPPLLDEAENGGLEILWIPIQFSNYEETKIKHYQAAWDPAKPLASLTPAKLNQALVAISKSIAEAMRG